MERQYDDRPPGGSAIDAQPTEVDEHEHGWQHWAMMALCCLPMIVLLVLALLGVWGAR
ncbi:MAG: hypothetical protein IVW55_12095 [Chloroflexi bacterium]|nr:hypothetical protein [Chloroflexota bacterium]